ncbi:hypothetical protein HHI36_001114 [Cryptolaemus montrouzieri]|uniref:SCP domain-containing protein n=1 Tax=Cryptolaemus montrouzieri TaxID=559131 RepID=A0ABD2P6Y5_9CUCU
MFLITLTFNIILCIILKLEFQCWAMNVDYCKLPCKTKNNTIEHVMCTLHNDCTVGAECKVRTKFQITREIKNFVLNVHNFYRDKIAFGEAPGQYKATQPQAGDLLEMVWDDELAYFAQCYANKCILQYDKCRQNSAGENIAQLIFIRVSVNPKSIEEIITEMVETVFYTSKHISVREIEQYREDKHTKQFSQLAWSRTNRIGCGITKLLEDLYAFYMVCNYGPAGSIEGEPVYKIGLPCSKCPMNRTCGEQYSGLCAATPEERHNHENNPTFLQVFERIVEPSIQRKLDYEPTMTYVSSDDTTTELKISDTSPSEYREEMVYDWDMTTLMKYIPTAVSSIQPEKILDHETFMMKEVDEDRNANIALDETAGSTISVNVSDSEELPISLCKIKKRRGWPHFDEQERTSGYHSNLLMYGYKIRLRFSLILLLSIQT